MLKVQDFREFTGWRWGMSVPYALHTLADLWLYDEDDDAPYAEVKAGYVWFADGARAAHWWVEDARYRLLDAAVLSHLSPVVRRDVVLTRSAADLVYAALRAVPVLRATMALDVDPAVQGAFDLLVGLEALTADEAEEAVRRAAEDERAAEEAVGALARMLAAFET